jgi:hypothetical protein
MPDIFGPLRFLLNVVLAPWLIEILYHKRVGDGDLTVYQYVAVLIPDRDSCVQAMSLVVAHGICPAFISRYCYKSGEFVRPAARLDWQANFAATIHLD